MLRVLGRCADKHDVAGLSVKGHKTGAPLFPTVCQLAQHIGAVMIARRRLHPQGVEFFRFRELLPYLGKAWNDPAAVTVNTDGAALPITLTRFVGVLQLSEQVVGDPVDALCRMLVPKTLDARNKTRPGSVLQLIEHGGVVLLVVIHCRRAPFGDRFRAPVPELLCNIIREGFIPSKNSCVCRNPG